MAIKKIQQRKDTAENWESANPILSDGEMGIESDTKKSKVGDGTTAWNDLDYAIVKITRGADEPAGGSNGDIHFQVSS